MHLPNASLARLLRPAPALLLLGVMSLASLAVACGGDEDPEGTTTPTTTVTSTATSTATAPLTATMTATPSATAGTDATPDSSPDATQAVPEDDASLEAYSALVAQVTAAFPDVTLIEDTGAFEVGGGEIVGDGRRVLVFGTASELPSYTEIAQTLRSILEDEGWTEDPQYAADGPTGTLSVWTKGDDLAVLGASASPQDPSACPGDQVIAVCLESLDPGEVNVQGSISVAVREE